MLARGALRWEGTEYLCARGVHVVHFNEIRAFIHVGVFLRGLDNPFHPNDEGFGVGETAGDV